MSNGLCSDLCVSVSFIYKMGLILALASWGGLEGLMRQFTQSFTHGAFYTVKSRLSFRFLVAEILSCVEGQLEPEALSTRSSSAFPFGMLIKHAETPYVLWGCCVPFNV